MRAFGPPNGSEVVSAGQSRVMPCSYLSPLSIKQFDEKTDVELQHDALMASNGKEEEFPGMEGLPPRTVRYNIIFFATGVNAAADFLGHNQDTINAAALAKLRKAYQEWCSTMQRVQQTTQDRQNQRDVSAKLTMAQALMATIEKKWQWTPGFKDYQLPATIANLAYLMGHTVQYNCKSGKDRTSVMDIESKFMAMRIQKWMAQSNQDPSIEPTDVYSLESDEDKANYRALLVEAGNLELQKLNTGAKGYKIIPKPWAEHAVATRIGHVADLVLGLTRTVEVKKQYKEKHFG
jgi:phosphatidylinositol-4,5-bisphosphate 4-phosphatase